MNFIMIVKMAAFVFSAAAFTVGCLEFMRKGKAMYFQIITLSVGCYSLGLLFSIIMTICTGTAQTGYNSGYLGITGCGLFLLSANYGQVNGILDDGTSGFRKKRVTAAAAPLALLVLWSAGAVICGMKNYFTSFMLLLPVFPASYFCLKVLVFPDMDFAFLKSIKPCNVCMLIICAAVTVQLTGELSGSIVLEIAGISAAAVSVCLMIRAAMNGGRAWTV